jgi:hypothetical protein
MLAQRQCAPTATTDITLTLARLTATTDLTGLRVECLSAPAHGMDGDAAGVGVVGVMATMLVAAGAMDGATTVDVASPVDEALLADADLHAVRPGASADRLAVGFMAALWPTAVAEGSTVVGVGSTAAVVDTVAADTGNRGGSGVS